MFRNLITPRKSCTCQEKGPLEGCLDNALRLALELSLTCVHNSLSGPKDAPVFNLRAPRKGWHYAYTIISISPKGAQRSCFGGGNVPSKVL